MSMDPSETLHNSGSETALDTDVVEMECREMLFRLETERSD